MHVSIESDHGVDLGEVNSRRPWERVQTSLGTVPVSPLNMDVVNIISDDLLINGVHYVLFGPLYWLHDHWSAFKEGRVREGDPTFALVRLDNRRRQASHAAYRKAVNVIEAAVNEWMPSEFDFAVLALASLHALLEEQVTELAQWYRDPETAERFQILVKVREDYLGDLGAHLEVVKRIIRREFAVEEAAGHSRTARGHA